MKSLTNLLSALVLALMTVAIAIFSIQNVEGASVRFLFWESINVPVGVLLAFCCGVGMILGGLAPLLFTNSSRRR